VCGVGDGRQLGRGVRDRRGGLIELVSRFRTGIKKEVTTLAAVKINEMDSRVEAIGKLERRLRVAGVRWTF
jgi:hypothetical protein